MPSNLNATTQSGDDELTDIYVGTAGYSYSHWRNGAFYSSTGISQNQELRYYSGIFATVEINASFHAVPRLETLQAWKSKAKPGFAFSFKVPKSITHESRLTNIDKELTEFISCLREGMGYDEHEIGVSTKMKVGPILFQLPPSLPKNIDLLNKIASLVPTSFKVAFEFRHKSWYVEEVYETMQLHNFGLCENISPDGSSIHVSRSTASTWHYIRCHKKEDRDKTNYTDQQLSAIADGMVERRRNNIVQFCYFLNDHEGNGPRNAKTLMKYIQEKSNEISFVLDWKPDPQTLSIKSMFSKSLSNNSTKVARNKAAIISASRKEKVKTQRTIRTLDAFVMPAIHSKRPKLFTSPGIILTQNEPPKKNEITHYFSSMKTKKSCNSKQVENSSATIDGNRDVNERKRGNS